LVAQACMGGMGDTVRQLQHRGRVGAPRKRLCPVVAGCDEVSHVTQRRVPAHPAYVAMHTCRQC
jgi:hypothetical protein